MYKKPFVSSFILRFLILGILAGPVMAEDPTLIFSVTPLENDPAASEVVIEIANTDPGEIWNVDVRLDRGRLGTCQAVHQLGRISAGTLKRIRLTCDDLDTAETELLVWRIDFDTDTGHRQVLTAGIEK